MLRRWNRAAVLGVALSVVLGGTIVAPSVSGAAGGVTARLSLNVDGLDADDASFEPAVTPDGRYVAFASDATDIVPNDENFSTDVFVLDTQTGAVERVSVASDGGESDDASYAPAISNNGCRIAFNSDSDELVEEDWNGSTDVFVHDRCDPSFGTKLASVYIRPSGTTGCPAGTYFAEYGTDWDERPGISGDGDRVVFGADSGVDECWALADENWSTDIFVYTFSTNTTVRVSQVLSGGEGAYQGAISQNGQYATFRTISKVAKTVVPVCPFNCFVSVVWRRAIDNLSDQQRVSETDDDKAPDGPSFAPTISADGRYVAFWSNAQNLVSTPDTNGFADVYVRDMVAKTTRRVSVALGGGPTDGHSREPSISRDGSTVAFTSTATNLVNMPDGGAADVFVRHLDTQQTHRASTSHTGGPADGPSGWPAVNTSGDKIVFQSDATQLIDDDVNDSADVFSYPEGDINPPTGVAITAPTHGGWNLHRSVPVAWTASDPQGIAYHDVVYSVTRWNGAPGSFVASWPKGDETTATNANLWGGYGRTYCFKTRAQDNEFNLSSWSGPRCSATPLNAWNYAYSKGWSRYGQAQSFAKTAARSTTTGAKITRTGVVAEKIALIATRCSTCGTVSVKLNGMTLKNISLFSPTTQRQQVIEVASRGWPYTGTLTVHVTSTGGRLVIVEGIGLYQV